MRVNCVIGIDPGKQGGIAIWCRGVPTKVAKMPEDMADLRDMLAYYAENYCPVVFVEKLNLHRDDFAEGGKVFRLQKLLENFAELKAVIAVSGVPYILVHPMTWQSRLKLRERGSEESKEERKRRYVGIAAELYPDVRRVTLWNADALLIMHFGRWAFGNDLKWVKANLPEREQLKLF